MTNDDKCATTACTSPATMEVFWPGETKRFCDPCARRARNVAAHLGLSVEARPLPAPAPEPTP